MSARPGSAPASWIGHLTPDPVTSLVTPGTGITSALIGGTLEMPSMFCTLENESRGMYIVELYYFIGLKYFICRCHHVR